MEGLCVWFAWCVCFDWFGWICPVGLVGLVDRINDDVSLARSTFGQVGGLFGF